MTDRELLEFAAKAAGIEIDEKWDFDESWGFRLEIGNGWWTPLTDDGDALRLAVKLAFCIDFGLYDGVWKVGVGTLLKSLAIEDITDDANAATRRSIVRAAAEIGKQLQS